MLWADILLLLILSATVLCKSTKPPHCEREFPTCSHQLPVPNLAYNNCSIRKIKGDSKECKDWVLKTNGVDGLGKVILRTYLFEYVTDNSSFYTVGLNSTFSDIKWSRLRMQYRDRSNESSNFCREINLNLHSPLPSGSELYYDCLWSNEHEDREYDFRYEAFDSNSGVTEGRHYIFKVPRCYNMLHDKPVKTWPIFMYVDISELPQLILRWQGKINVTKYEVGVYQEGKCVRSKFVTGTADEFGMFSFLYDIGITSGEVYFQVNTVHEDCSGSCDAFKSPIINIAENLSYTPLLIGIVGSVFLLPVVLYSLYIWKRYSILGVDCMPSVLLVYKRCLSSHIKVVVAFAKYLREHCHIDALVDELDIPLTKSKDPFKWYQEAFARADAIVVISSPPCSDALEEGIYHKVDLLALRILAEKYGDSQRNQKMMSLLLPYCFPNDIPIEAKNLKCYSFKKDFNELLWNLRYGLKSYWISKIDYLFYRSYVAGGGSDLRRYGGDLLQLMEEAEDDVKRRRSSVSRNREEVDCENVPLQPKEDIAYEADDIFDFEAERSSQDLSSDAEETFTEYPGAVNVLLEASENCDRPDREEPVKGLPGTKFDIDNFCL